MMKATTSNVCSRPPACCVLGSRIDSVNYATAVDIMVQWAVGQESRYVCAAPVATIMEGHDSDEFRKVLECSDLTTPDGMPVVWTLRLLGVSTASRVYGPDLTLELLGAAEREDLPVGFYGGSQTAIDNLKGFVGKRFPRLRVVYAFSPPFRTVTPEEDERYVAEINASGARILFVGIGSPRQERWMSSHRGLVRSVMVGVGAAFDYFAGTKRQAPRWMRNAGLEWLFRLMCEPARLMHRNLKHNPRYLFLAALQIVGITRYDASRRTLHP
jgi:N-acetylglucosaminyldiphosphoundecaprenol N-acetyl-beta-D-mannosaminyltransferase